MNKGFGILELLFAIGITTVGVGVAISLNGSIFKAQKMSSVSGSRLMAKDQLISQISHAANWKASLQDPQNADYMQCILAGKNCKSLPSNLRVIGENGTVLYDENQSGTGGLIGTKADGSTCFGFNPKAGHGNDDCPQQYQLTWTVTCVKFAGACREPQAHIFGTLVVNSPSSLQNLQGMNSSKANFEVLMNLPDIGALRVVNQDIKVNKGTGTQVVDILNNKHSLFSSSANVKIVDVKFDPAKATVTWSASKFVYQPLSTFYGRDRLVLTLQENRYGSVLTTKSVVWIKVMTPFTWTGEGRANDIYDDLNWCGTVVNNQCTHNVSLSDSNQRKSANLVFNDACEICDAELTSTSILNVASLELSSTYQGTLTQKAPMTLFADRALPAANDPNKVYGLSQFGGHFAGLSPRVAGANSLEVGFSWPATPPATASKILEIQAGTFDAPEGKLVVHGYSTVIGNNQSYVDHGGTFVFVPNYLTGNILQARDWFVTNFQVSNGAADAGFDNVAIFGNFRVQNLIFDRAGMMLGNLQIIDDPGNLKSGMIEVSGDVTSPSPGGNWELGGEPAKIVLNGKNDQNVSTAVNGFITTLFIEKPAGTTVHFGSQVSIAMHLVWKSGNVDSALTDLELGNRQGNRLVMNNSGNPLKIRSLLLDGQRWAYTAFTGQDVIVSGDFTQDYCYWSSYSCEMGGMFTDGTARLLVGGNVYIKSGFGLSGQGVGYYGTLTNYAFLPITLNGTGVQTVNGPAPSAVMSSTPCLSSPEKTCLQGLIVNKPSGSARFVGGVGISSLLLASAGQSLDFSASSLELVTQNGWDTLKIDVDPSTYASAVPRVSLAGRLNFSNKKYLFKDVDWYPHSSSGGEMSTLWNGSVDLEGNLKVTDASVSEQGWTADYSTWNFGFNLTGSGRQELSLPFNAGWAGPSTHNTLKLFVNKSGGTVEQMLSVNLYKDNPSTQIEIAAGTWNTNGNSLSANRMIIGAGATLNMGGAGIGGFGTLTNSGTLNP